MLRAFVILWLMVFLPISFLMFSYGYSPVWLITNYVQSSIVKDQNSGLFYLLEKELKQYPEDEWQNRVKQLAKHFSYKLELQSLREIQQEQKEQLSKGEFVFIEGVPNILKRRIAGTDWVILAALDMDENETYLRSVKGGAHMLLKEFEQTPEADWSVLLEELNEHFSYQFELKQKPQLPLTAQQIEVLENNEIVWRHNDNVQFEFYRQLPDNNTVLKAITPAYGNTQVGLFVSLFFTFITIVSLCMVVWVYPLWRDLKKLSRTAKAFGNGSLEKRATHSKASVITDLSSSFNAMADNIQELIVGQRNLTNAIAHDLRTPLYRLKFALEMLDDNQLNKAEKEHYRECVTVSIEDLDHLIDQTLILSRYRRITDFSQFSETVFAKVITKETQQFRLQHTNLHLAVEIADSLSEQLIYADCPALSRVLSNLLSNASQFAKQEIRVQFLDLNDNYRLVVEDDGPGIAEEHWETLFNAFTQVNNQHRGKTQGHGLGLAIVEQIAQWHKGEVNVDKAELGGARFSLTWPKKMDE